MFNEKNIILRFPVLSDIHISGKNSYGSKKLEKAYTQLKTHGEHDLIMYAGDMTDFGLDEQIEEFASITSRFFDLEQTQVFFAAGNHELYNNEINHAPLTVGEDFKKHFGEHAYVTSSDDEIHRCLDYRIINGFHFIAFHAYKYLGGVGFYDSDIEWLKSKLDAATADSPDKPIFICAHPMIVGTCYGSDYGGPDGGYWASPKLFDLLKKYPKVMYFAGHLHFPLQNEKSLWCGEFCAINTASVFFASGEATLPDGTPFMDIQSGSETADAFDFSQGLITEVDDKFNVRITRLDFEHDKEIKKPWIINVNNASASLENAVLPSCPPHFNNNARICEPVKRFDTEIQEYELEFDAAVSDDMVMGYLIEYISACDNSVITRFALYSDFYLASDSSQMKPKIRKPISLERLKPFDFSTHGGYRIRISAFDCFGAYSSPIESDIIPACRL